MTRIMGFAFIAGVLCLSTARAADGETIGAKKFAKRLAAAEEAFEGADWSFDYTETTPSAQLETAERDPRPISGSVRWNRTNQRYHFVFAGTMEWIGGKADYLSRRVGMSFDGRNYYYWSHGWYGKKLPPVIADPEAGIKGVDPKDLPRGEGKIPPLGRIARDEMPGKSFQLYKGVIGLHFLPDSMPYIFEGNDLHPSLRAAWKEANGRLSTFLAKLPPDAISIRPVKDVDDQFRVTIAPAGLSPEMSYMSYELIIDVANFGLVRRAKAELQTPKDMEHIKKYEMATVPASGPGVTSMRIESQHIIDGDVIRKREWRLTEFVFNPDREFADFQLRFPPSTYIDNRITGRQYRFNQNDADRLKTVPRKDHGSRLE